MCDEYSLLKATGTFCDTLPRQLVSPAQQVLLKKAADFLPPIIRFGLECRLNNDDQVDLQLCIRREDDLNAIYNWLRRRLTGDEEHEMLLRFLKSWADPSSACYQHIAEIFLELDVLPSGIKTPLLFFELNAGLTPSQTRDFCFSLLKDTLGDNKAYFSALEIIFSACSAPAHVGYLGILFSRDTEVLRVNIKKLSFAAVSNFLQQIGYAWTGPALDQWISLIYNYADRVTLCIDIGKNVHPQIGFECFWNEAPHTETYWRAFIEKLPVHQDLCQQKIEAILSWDRDIFPGQIDSWPEHLWIASLSKPQHEFTFLKKWISHVKVSYHPDKTVALKAYLGYESRWKAFKKEDNQADAQHGQATTPDIQQVLNKGIDYLLSSQLQSGWWKDFHLVPGSSDEWVTAYVACHLAHLKSPKVSTALEKAWRILQTRYREQEGWGYNMLTPADADSTVWTWLFVNAAGFSKEFPAPLADMMQHYVAEDGGISTYSPFAAVGSKSAESFHGWQIPHCCVTAAYALAGYQHAIDYLLKQQQSTGYWYSYWWDGYEYVTALSVEALSAKDANLYKGTIEKAVKWAVDQAQRELANAVPSAFKTALLLRILLCSPQQAGHHNLLQRMADYLLMAQQSSGYWNPSAELRSPHPHDTAHEKGEKVIIVKDEKKNFATITILNALHKYAQAMVTL
ncbi:hypothetical protein [Chitinophaga varians]|uniref:hypothetical protein n=1 Tax=Chitinophaga varians TaxID=2202339 RepID=UPI00165F2501|nr:hypothetical protein [Chitinophaga varians]MBC9909733.1 hypothetical protein [Chitinophaga varians]